MALGENQVMVDGEVREIDHWIEHSDNYIQTWKSNYQDWNQPGKILAFRPGNRGHIRFLQLNAGTEDKVKLLSTAQHLMVYHYSTKVLMLEFLVTVILILSMVLELWALQVVHLEWM